ncbi:translation initiation factor IF-2 [candidate division TA06 bacterium]|uniref:Translation initiation factor IF-2 n=1 Tax=candidate division TA06 bacterium TaxID=2250710 RepID=A0A523UTD4_UNCT6|nr:MAG: translation initiation factor IF-2 [candidate division TA06 bacterium]
MANQRIYQAARDFDLSSEALLKVIRSLGFTVKSHMSVITEEMIEAVKKRFAEEKAAAKETDMKRVREREQMAKPRTSTVRLERPRKKGKRTRPKKRKIDQKKIRQKVRETLIQMEKSTRTKKKRYKSERVPDAGIVEENKLRVSEFVSVSEVGSLLDVEPTEIIAKLLELGLVVTINHRLDFETISMIAEEYGYEAELIPEYGAQFLDTEEEKDEDLTACAPVVTVMGHVDHGKTSLLDKLRKTDVTAGESGGMTQHIGAYEVKVGENRIAFLDTPGHEAFTAMRARGAQLTDICVLVVAADDGVMPQTIEAIDHARAAGVPIVIAINKIDLPTANSMKVKQDLAQHGVLAEEFGGSTLCVEVSAKTGEGLDELIETILLQAEMLDLRACCSGPARGVVVESKLDRGKGTVATLLVQKGCLHVGDAFVAGLYSGKVRAMHDEHGVDLAEVGPSTAVQIIGFTGIPEVGDTFFVVEDEARARTLSRKRMLARREQAFRAAGDGVSLRKFQEDLKSGKSKELKIVLKGDVWGSVGALADSLQGLSTDEVKVKIIHSNVGSIKESDILLGAASKAIVVGFHVKPDARAKEMAARDNVEVRLYDIIFEAIDDIKLAMTGLLEPEFEEVVVGKAEVKQIFKISKLGMIAGCSVISGEIRRGISAKLMRESESIGVGIVDSLKRFKDDVREVPAGMECGIGISGQEDIQVGDIIECFEMKEVLRSLS